MWHGDILHEHTHGGLGCLLGRMNLFGGGVGHLGGGH
jgi:hypothetical protein